MSFAIFDSLFVILSEEIDVPVSKLKKAWDISLLKFFKTDPNVLAKVAPKLQQAKKPTVSLEDQQEDPVSEEQVVQEPVVTSKAKPKKATKPKEEVSSPSEPKTKKTPAPAKKDGLSGINPETKQAPSKEPIKLPNCDEANCTIKVKLSRPIDGKNYCSKHYQKHSKALAKKDGLSEDSVKPALNPKSTVEAPKQIVKELEKSDSEDEESPEEDIEPELETEEEEIEEEHLESEQEDDESSEMILENLKEGFDRYFKQPVTAQNFTKVGTMDQYLVFFRNNWHDFQKVYEGLVTADELQALIQKKKVQKADLFSYLRRSVLS